MQRYAPDRSITARAYAIIQVGVRVRVRVGAGACSWRKGSPEKMSAEVEKKLSGSK